MIEPLELRQFLSADGIAELEAAAVTTPAVTADAVPAAAAASRHHAHHVHTLHHQHELAVIRRQESHRHHLHTVHVVHHDHFLHTQHRAHVLRTTVPAPIVLTAQQRNDWATIRDEVMANRKRVPK
jgi:hypothetical protein